MYLGLLETSESIWVRLGPNKEITKAAEPVFLESNQDEARTMIFESHYFLEYLEEFASQLSLGEPKFASVTEQGRQTSFRYGKDGADAILLTRAHQSIDRVLAAIEKTDA